MLKIFSNFSFPGDDEFDICCFSGKFHDRKYGREGEVYDFREALKNLPPSWEPDVVIFRTLLHWRIPAGLEDCPYPTVGLLDDWYSGLGFLPDNCLRFDYIYTDKAGMNILKRLGMNNVSYWPHFGHDPFIFRKLDNQKKIYDISYAGSFNLNFQKERLPWLRRLCRIDKKYNIKLFHDIPKDEYARVLNRTKIAFNRSLKGEMNLRAFEAPACGALLFIEEENLEVRDFFEPGKEVILYNNNNLEDLLIYYLEHEKERAEIAEAGYRKVQEYSHPELFKRLVKSIREKKIKPGSGRSSSSFITESREHCNYLQSVFSIGGIGRDFLDRTKAMLAKQKDNPVVLNDCGVLICSYIGHINDQKTIQELLKLAESLLRLAIKINPSYTVAKFNRAQLLLHLNKQKHKDALQIYTELADLQSLYSWNNYKGIIFPLGIGNDYSVLWSMALAHTMPNEEKMVHARHDLIRFFSAQRVALISEALREKEKALKYLEFADTLVSEHHSVMVPYAKLQGENKDFMQTEDIIGRAMKADPFNSDLWKEYIKMFFAQGRIEEAKAAIEDSLLCLARLQDCPSVKENLGTTVGQHDSIGEVIEDFNQMHAVVGI